VDAQPARRLIGWRTALRLGRVSNLPTVWTNVLAGSAIAGGPSPWPLLILLLAAMSLVYVAGMYLNDAFDRDIDARERPTRPIPAGKAAAGTVLGAGFAMLGVGLGLLFVAGVGVGIAGTALAAAVVLYDRFHKGHAWGPVLMGLCRALVYLAAGLAVTTTLPAGVWVAAALLWSYTIGLSYVAKHETLADIRSFWPLLCLAAPVLWLVPAALASAWTALPLIGFLAWIGFALSWLRCRAGRNIPRAVTSLIAGIALLDAAFISTTPATALLPVALAAFLLTLYWQRYVPGT